MSYRREIPFSGDACKAIDLATSTLVHAGYRITDAAEDSVTGEHVGGLMRTQSGQAIYGASPITVELRAGRLLVTARYDGIAKVRRFLVRLLVGLATFLGLGLGIGFALAFEEAWPVALGVGLGTGIPLIQLPIHLGVTLSLVRTRATQALDTLGDNIVTLATR